MTPKRPAIPVIVTRRRGFSLVLSLTVMSMLLLLCIGAAAILAIELRMSRASASYARARLNAMAGARIALGEVQRLLGPDQRVSATADLLCDPAKTDPRDSSYYQNSKHGLVTHPRWVGVWNSGRVDDGQSVPNASEGEQTKVIQRTTDGYLMDSRFANGRDWADSRAGNLPAAVTKRLAGWLVSGNEALSANDPVSITPFTPIDRTKDAVLVGPGALGSLFVESADSDRLGARARKVALVNSAGNSTGSYAYWVADEGVKARFNLRDRFEGVEPNKANFTDGGMFRLMLPQRNDFTAVENPVDSERKVTLTNYAQLALSKKTEGGWSDVTGFSSVGLVDTSVDSTAFMNRYYHDVSFTSSGVLADVANGGLKKDLTAYLNKGADIPDFGGVINSGIVGATPLLSDDSRKVISPKLALLGTWWKQGVSGSDSFVGIGVPETQPKTYSIRHSRWAGGFGPPIAPASFTLGMPSYANSSNKAPISPLLTAFDYHYAIGFEKQGATGNTCEIKFLFYPKITLWNPYSVAIKPAEDLRVAYLTYIQPRFNTYLAYLSLRPVRWFNLGKVTLEPGQAITFVPSAGQDFSVNYRTVPTHPDVAMVPGLPSNSTYYLDRGASLYNSTTIGINVGTDNLGFWSGQMMEMGDVPGNQGRNCFMVNDPAYDEAQKGGPLNQVFLVQGSSSTPAVLQQVNMDSWSALLNTDTTYGTLRMQELSSLNPVSQTVAESAASGPINTVHHGFRLLRLDDSANTGGDPGTLRNTNRNPFVNFNFRSPRITRHPYDGAHLARVNNYHGFGPLTNDRTLDLMDPSQWSSSAMAASPLLNPSDASSISRFALMDVPRTALGLLSLGQLQHAPLVQMPWAPGFPVGNSFLPLQDADISEERLDQRSGYSRSVEDKVWAKVNSTSQFNNYIRGMSGGTMPWGAPLDNQCTCIDWSYELNHALWDTWMSSGMPAGNDGWSSSAWDFDSITSGKTSPNSRFIAVSKIPSGGYYSDANFSAYRVASSLLQDGQFNVNSTSVVAWQALLSAFRGIRVPTQDGQTNGATQTPYARMTVPVTGPVSNSGDQTYAKATWGGFRALSDDEIRSLAQKIVTEVKLRGPFLSLGDFVNRRLRSAESAYSDWNASEKDYLGAIQAAINSAELNKALTPDEGSALAMKRSDADKDVLGSMSTSAIDKPQHKVKDKLTGAPGYLMQSDILQKIGPVLSARSDTFTIRARGESEDGAVAVVELVVQRTPEPLRPATGADGVLPINPKSIAGGGVYSGNQFFGRRMRVLSTRWLALADL